MARKKVTLEYIKHDKTRSDTLKKRSKSLMKKAGEVAILCNTKACVIIYPEGESVPQVFSSHDEMGDILNRFRSMKDDDRFNKKMHQECFLNKRMGKLQKQALQSKRECEESELKLLLHKAMLMGHAELSMEELTKVGYKVEVFLKSIRDRITKICGQPPVYMPSQAQALAPNITGIRNTIGAPAMYRAQTPTPDLIGGMGAIQAPVMYQAQVPTTYVTGGMDTIGAPMEYQAQAPPPYATGGMDTIGAPIVYQSQVPPLQQQEWFELMRTGGGDLGGLICNDFNGGATLSSTAGLNGNEMMNPLDPGAWFGCPWGGVDPGPSSSAFPPM